MQDEMQCIEIAMKNHEAFALCLALGTLQAIKCGSWKAESAIWTIARPIFWQPLESMGISSQLLNVLQSADELEAIQTLVGAEQFEQQLAEWIAIIQNRLAEIPEQSWYLRWSIEKSS